MKNQNMARLGGHQLSQCPVCKLKASLATLGKHKKGELCWGDSVPILNEETKAIWSYWKAKKQRDPFLLSPLELIGLLSDAGITIYDVGQTTEKYALARNDDSGNYEIGNCRFITVNENIREKKARKCHTPYGSFNSLQEAVDNTGIIRGGIVKRFNSDSDRWIRWQRDDEKTSQKPNTYYDPSKQPKSGYAVPESKYSKVKQERHRKDFLENWKECSEDDS